MMESQDRNVCSTCGGPLSKMVKRCPHCNTRQAGKGHGGIAAIAVIITIILLVPAVITCAMVMLNYEKFKEYLIDGLSQSVEAGTAVDSDGVSLQLKAFLDSYEACVDELCEAMPSTLSGQGGPDTKVPALTEKYEELSARAAEYQQAELSSADHAYYLAAMARIQDKLQQAGIISNTDATVDSKM